MFNDSKKRPDLKGITTIKPYNDIILLKQYSKKRPDLKGITTS